MLWEDLIKLNGSFDFEPRKKVNFVCILLTVFFSVDYLIGNVKW